METVPRAYEAQRPFGERAVEHGRVGEDDPCLVLPVGGVVVRRIVIVPVDVDGDPVEL